MNRSSLALIFSDKGFVEPMIPSFDYLFFRVHTIKRSSIALIFSDKGFVDPWHLRYGLLGLGLAL